jgi:hypothetical protein
MLQRLEKDKIMHINLRKVIRHKYGAIKCQRDGIKFRSRLERAYYDQLLLRQKSGEVLFFLMEVPFALPGNTKHLIDFQIFLADGTVEFVECKGKDLPMGILKRKQVEDLYPIEIKVIRQV